MLQRYPYLAHVPSDAPQGVDTPLPPPPTIDWDGKGELIPVNPPQESDTAPSPKDEESAPPTSPQGKPTKESNTTGTLQSRGEFTTWHDVALSIASEMMMQAREGVLIQLGYSTSAVSELIVTASSFY